jgi:hypothetical protein
MLIRSVQDHRAFLGAADRLTHPGAGSGSDASSQRSTLGRPAYWLPGSSCHPCGRLKSEAGSKGAVDSWLYFVVLGIQVDYAVMQLPAWHTRLCYLLKAFRKAPGS